MNPFLNSIADLQLLGTDALTLTNSKSSKPGQTSEAAESASFLNFIQNIISETSNGNDFASSAADGQQNQLELLKNFFAGEKDTLTESELDRIIEQLLTPQNNSESVKKIDSVFENLKESVSNILNSKSQIEKGTAAGVAQSTGTEIKSALIQSLEENGIGLAKIALIAGHTEQHNIAKPQSTVDHNLPQVKSGTSLAVLLQHPSNPRAEIDSETVLQTNPERQPVANQPQTQSSKLLIPEMIKGETGEFQSKTPVVGAIVSENSRALKLQAENASNQEVVESLPSDKKIPDALLPTHRKFLGATARGTNVQLEIHKVPGETLQVNSVSTEGLLNSLSEPTNSLSSIRLTPANQAQPFGPAKVPMNSLAVHIASQANNGARRFEIRLDPPELGRIDVRLEFSRDGMVRTLLLVELPETLEMLQRDSRALERALNDSGLQTNKDSLSFSLKDQGFAGQRSFGDQFEEAKFGQSGQSSDVDDQEENQEQTVNPNVIARNGLDIRI